MIGLKLNKNKLNMMALARTALMTLIVGNVVGSDFKPISIDNFACRPENLKVIIYFKLSLKPFNFNV